MQKRSSTKGLLLKLVKDFKSFLFTFPSYSILKIWQSILDFQEYRIMDEPN